MQITKKTQRQASIAAISGLVIIGAASLLFKTYPHLNPFCRKDTKEIKKDETTGETNVESTEESVVLVDYSKMSIEEVTALLQEKKVEIPESASLEDLIELAKGI